MTLPVPMPPDMPPPQRPPPSPPAPDSTRGDSTSSDRSLTAPSERNTTPASPRQLSLRSTSPSSRLLAQTHASRAKLSPASWRRKPLPSARPLSSSKIPRRDTSLPAATTPATRWGARIAQRITDAEQSNQYALRTPSATSTGRCALSTDKPLPPRPISSLTSLASPSKDTRTLIDASERPLHLSIDGRTLEWPAINPSPRSVSAPGQLSVIEDAEAVQSSVPGKSSHALDTLAASTNAFERLPSRSSVLSCRSSMPSFVSAEESVGNDVHSDSASVLDVTPHKSLNQPLRSDVALPRRTRSIATPSSDVVLDTGSVEPDSGVPPLPDRAKHIRAAASVSSKQAGSSANFSRPHGMAVSSKTMHSTPDSTRGSMSTRQQKTASRIPLPGSSRARLVNVESQNIGLDTQTLVERSPSFGARRLNSPNALAVLDLGTKRRMQRTNTNGSVVSENSHFLPPPIRALRASSRSRSSSPAATVGASTDDEDEVTTPISQPSLPRSGSMAKLTPPNPETDRYEPVSASPLDVPRMRRNPPSKSRHTRPLQTIPSQTVLTAGMDGEILPTTNYSTVAKRLSQARCTSVQNENPFAGASDAEVHTHLTFVRGQDDAHVKSGLPGLSKEAKGELDRTLDRLEGHGTPPSESVDPEKLNDLFGQLTWRSTRGPRTNTFLDNAAAAAMFVDRGSVSSEQIKASNSKSGGRQKAAEKGQQDITAPLPTDKADAAQVAVSKWSDSTPSAPASSAVLPLKNQQTSIGYPSANKTPIHVPEITSEAQGRSEAFTSRNSSPILGSTKYSRAQPLGSVRRARENMAAQGGLPRPTASTTSKRTTKSPMSASKGTRKTAGSIRGRDSTAISSRMKSPHTANVFDGSIDRASRTEITGPVRIEPRSRSKSRTVLDKINGFFSHKREKKSQQFPVPPLPSLEREKTTSMATLDVQIDDSEPFRHSPTPPVPAMPANIQLQSEQARSLSRATNASDVSLSSIFEGASTVVTLAEKLIRKAKMTGSAQQKARLVGFAKVLNEVMLNVKEAHISAEKARQSAIEADMSYQMAKKGLEMMEKLASSLVKSGVRH